MSRFGVAQRGGWLTLWSITLIITTAAPDPKSVKATPFKFTALPRHTPVLNILLPSRSFPVLAIPVSGIMLIGKTR